MLIQNTIGKLPEWHVQKKYMTNEDDNIIGVLDLDIGLVVFQENVGQFQCWNDTHSLSCQIK